MRAGQLSDAQLSRLAPVLASLRLLVFDFDGVFTDNMVTVFEDGREAVRCWRGDGIGLRRLEAVGVQSLILSTETNPVVSERAAKLKIRCIQACGDKLVVMRSEVDSAGLDMSVVGYVGNDINDADCLKAVALPIVVADACDEVLGFARLRTRSPGGKGAVREVCDLVFNARRAGGDHGA